MSRLLPHLPPILTPLSRSPFLPPRHHTISPSSLASRHRRDDDDDDRRRSTNTGCPSMHARTRLQADGVVRATDPGARWGFRSLQSITPRWWSRLKRSVRLGSPCPLPFPRSTEQPPLLPDSSVFRRSLLPRARSSYAPFARTGCTSHHPVKQKSGACEGGEGGGGVPSEASKTFTCLHTV